MSINYAILLQADKLKLKTIRVLFPLHREGLTSYLSPILGQYAIKNTEFINEFVIKFNLFTKNIFKEQLNLESAEAGGALYNDVLFVPLIVDVYKAGKFTIKVNPPALGFLYSSMFKKKRRFYRNLFNTNNLTGLKNYKKLLQLSSFKFLKLPSSLGKVVRGWHYTFFMQEYWMTRNALHHKR